jgi:plastocyanin
MDPSPAEANSTGPRAQRFAARLVAIALALGAAGCATTGSIRGTLAIAPPTGRPDSAMVAHGAAGTDLASVTNAVVFVVRDPEAKPAPGRWWKRARMGETPSGFEPSVIAIPAGTTVKFENRDSIYHGAFSVATAKRFNTGLYAPGQKRPVRFDRPGLVNLYCELHPEALGFIVVRPDRLFARPNASGEFRLPRLAEGTYTVKAWHPIYGETSQRVLVPRKGHTIVRLAL